MVVRRRPASLCALDLRHITQMGSRGSMRDLFSLARMSARRRGSLARARSGVTATGRIPAFPGRQTGRSLPVGGRRSKACRNFRFGRQQVFPGGPCGPAPGAFLPFGERSISALMIDRSGNEARTRQFGPEPTFDGRKKRGGRAEDEEIGRQSHQQPPTPVITSRSPDRRRSRRAAARTSSVVFARR
jgi:hypothetical protein